MKAFKKSIFFLIPILLSVTTSAQEKWLEDFEEALKEAKEQDKIVLVSFSHPW